MLSEKIVTTDGAAFCTASAKLICSEDIAAGRFILGNSVLRRLGLNNTTKKAMPKPVKSGGRINLKSFSTVFLLSMSNPLMMAQKK
jgi:hypothetical protein